ncbi:MAG: Nucleolar protein 16 [Cirrosporium novae-zelandiae]|nr:MAG: Nucleolar protein 16 [Cirrosporium novae-zelandiae]
MGRELQKKKNRSSIPKVKRKQKSKKLNFKGNQIISQNWDKNLTLSQNYRRLGLTAKLNSSIPHALKITSATSAPNTDDPFTITNNPKSAVIVPKEARIERDPETGAILRIVDPDEENRKHNPLNDPLNDLESDSESDPQPSNSEHGIIAQLEAEAALEAPKKPRTQSKREVEWIEALVEKYGDDTRKMFWDKRLNPMQQTEADIKKRIKKWKQTKAREECQDIRVGA